MDHYEILHNLTTIDKQENGGGRGFDHKLQDILQKIDPMLVEEDKKFIENIYESENESLDVRYQYIRTIVRILQNVKNSDSTNEGSAFSVKQFRTLKVCIELLIALGIVPALLPGVGIDMAKLCPKASQMCKQELSDMQKYRRLCFVVNSIMNLYEQIMFRPAILAQIGPLLAALLQLCYAPLMKPSLKTIEPNKSTNGGNFKMTAELYDELKKDQKHFQCLLHKLMTNCPKPTIMKELMVILGIKGAPRWLRHETRKHLVLHLMQANGVVSIIAATCDDILDVGEHWKTLDTISRLIATSHGNDPDEYFKSICPQILNLLASTDVKHSATIANCCIAALYEYNANICVTNIVKVMCEPLLVNLESAQQIVASEVDVEKCIDNLSKCFTTTEAQFKQLPCKLLTNVAIPLFSLYNTVRDSACILKNKIKQLLLKLLHEESLRSDLYAAFLGHNGTNNFGNYLASKFGPTGGIEITGVDKTCRYEEFADALFDLIFTTDYLLTELFFYLLKYLSNSVKLYSETKNLLDPDDGLMGEIEKQLATVKLLSRLANIPAVQKAQVEEPLLIVSLTKTIFNQYINRKQNAPQMDDPELLYICLMLLKMILGERKKPLNWVAFNDFAKYLKECCSFAHISPQLLALARELVELIESQGRSGRKQYQDLSLDRAPSNKFEEALRDLADPLLPVRAHGLVSLTKLIDSGDECTIAAKAVLLEIFKANLVHEDSFIYLAAINGLCALASSYPQEVIETLVHEYIDFPQRVLSGDVTAETRTKLGEILVKVTSALGDIAPAYKNILINGFLCATRDPDSLVRASSLSCLGELCKVLGYRLGDIVTEVIYCISCIVKTDKAAECRRAAVMVSTLLFRGLGKDTLTSISKDLIELYRGLKYLRNNDEDPVLRLHAQLALEEIDYIVQDLLFSPPKLEKKIYLLNSP